MIPSLKNASTKIIHNSVDWRSFYKTWKLGGGLRPRGLPPLDTEGFHLYVRSLICPGEGLQTSPGISLKCPPIEAAKRLEIFDSLKRDFSDFDAAYSLKRDDSLKWDFEGFAGPLT